jgi:hypothetical protein
MGCRACAMPVCAEEISGMYPELMARYYSVNKGSHLVLLLCNICVVLFGKLAFVEITRMLIDSAVQKNLPGILNGIGYLAAAVCAAALIRIAHDILQFRLYSGLLCLIENAGIASVDTRVMLGKAEADKRISVIRNTVERLCTAKYDLFNGWSECISLLVIMSAYTFVIDHRVLAGCYIVSGLSLFF